MIFFTFAFHFSLFYATFAKKNQNMAKEFIVTSRQDATSRNGSPYVNLKCANKSGVENICVWNTGKMQGPKVGQTVTFINIKEFQGKKSADSSDMIVGKFPEEDHPLYSFMPRPIKRAVWDETMEKLLSYCKDEKLTDIIRNQATQLFEPYSKKPAATSVHHAFPGGLLNHTWQMLRLFEGLYPCYPYPEEIKAERIILAILFHDWGKLCEYNTEGENQENRFLLGHIYMSANYLNGILREAGVEKRETNLIIHCVLAHHGELEFGSPVLPCTPEASLVNYIDNISAKADVYHTTGNLEKSFALGTNVVK